MRAQSVIGKQFDLLTVKNEYTNEKGYRICLCECECGNMKEVYKSNLIGKKTKSCGCLGEKNRRKFKDLTDMQFERLKVIARTNQRIDGNVVWECLCKCGKTVFVSGRNLTRGDTKSCGCISEEKRDITNQRFGPLVALYPDKTSKKGRQKWICRCDCKNFCSVNIANLRNGHTKSCECLHKKEYRTMVEGTCLEMIASKKISINNKSGVKGVSYSSRKNVWVLRINFQGRHYCLGEYSEIPTAARARKLAEERLFEPVIEKYRHLLKKENNNPQPEDADGDEHNSAP
jgi:hypothetical protein